MGLRDRALYQRAFAWGMAHAAHSHERRVAGVKRRLFRGIGGTILEIGPGTGTNFRYYPRGSVVLAVEPNPYMHPWLRRRAARAGLDLRIIPVRSEALPLDDGCADVAVATLVLCSVGDPPAVLREVRRALRPGGRFLFVEHVAAPRGTGLRMLQRLVRPGWGCIGDGCQPDRETLAVVLRAGFATVRARRFDAGLPVIGPHVAGAARNPADSPCRRKGADGD